MHIYACIHVYPYMCIYISIPIIHAYKCALYAVLDDDHRGAFEKQLDAPPFPSASPCVPHVPIPGADQFSSWQLILFPLKYSCSSSKLAGFLHFGGGRSMKENWVLHHPKKNPKSVFSLRVEIPTENEASHRTVKTHSLLNTVCAFVLICIWQGALLRRKYSC